MEDFPAREPKTKWSDEQIDFAIKILEKNGSVMEAAKRLGTTSDSLRNAFKRRELPSPSTFLRDCLPEDEVYYESKIINLDKKDKLSWKTHLIIPDAHAKPGVDNDRFYWLGQLIVDKKPDVIVCIGDFADMESLSSYDKGKRSFEGRRYKKDVESVIEAQKILFEPIIEYNETIGREKGVYKPRLVMCLGNHENRINRVTNDSPELDGILSISDLQYEKFGWEVYGFLDRVIIDGIAYSHYFGSGVMNRPIGGEHSAANLIKKQFMSCTAGHSHIRDFSERTRADGKKIVGLVCGCYFDHDEEYASNANALWWRGIVIKNHVDDGEYEPEFINIKTLREMYSETTN